MSNADAAGAAHNASVTTEPVEQEPTKPTVEMDDGWTVTADTPKELTRLIDRKLDEAHRAKADADRAIKHWTAVSKKAAK